MPRRLRPEEELLWRRIASHATPLRRERPEQRKVSPAQPVPSTPRPPESAPTSIPEFRIGEASQPAPPPAPRRTPLHLDRRTQKQLSRGKRQPEATIDLHGMTLDQAHAALSRFILASFATGRRLVLVVTGKGRGPETSWDARKGVLRRQVPDWLASPPLGGVVQELLPAHRSHGGSGAYYVILRRN